MDIVLTHRVVCCDTSDDTSVTRCERSHVDIKGIDRTRTCQNGRVVRLIDVIGIERLLRIEVLQCFAVHGDPCQGIIAIFQRDLRDEIRGCRYLILRRYNDVDHIVLVHEDLHGSQRVAQLERHIFGCEVVFRIRTIRVLIDILGLRRTEVRELIALQEQACQERIRRLNELEDDGINSLVLTIRGRYCDIQLNIAVRQLMDRLFYLLLLVILRIIASR